MPEKAITEEAKRVNGWTKKKLMDKKAKKFTKGESEKLTTFLNKHRDLPIVAHNIKYDRDQVLGPAYLKVKNFEGMPDHKRWKCTYQMSFRVEKMTHRTLDDCLEHFEFEPRDTDAVHDAMNDCILTAKVYMELAKIPEEKKWTLGFTKE